MMQRFEEYDDDQDTVQRIPVRGRSKEYAPGKKRDCGHEDCPARGVCTMGCRIPAAWKECTSYRIWLGTLEKSKAFFVEKYMAHYRENFQLIPGRRGNKGRQEF